MENINTHSKPKLALAVLTSPTAAFEEIIRRRLLGTGLIIVAITGVLSFLPPLILGLGNEQIKLLELGKYNPLAWFGLCLLYAFALQKLLKWLGTNANFTDLLTIMGWSQITLLVAELAAITLSILTINGSNSKDLMSFLGAIRAGFPLWYVVLIGIGIAGLCNTPVSRGILSYLVVEISAWIAFVFTYGRARFAGFEGALQGIGAAAGAVASSDCIPWLAAGVIGLVLGLWEIGKQLDWDSGQTKRSMVTVGLIGIAVFGCYMLAMAKANYYGKLLDAQASYNDKDYGKTARQLINLTTISKDNIPLILDIADVYYLDGKDGSAIDYYLKARKMINKSLLQDNDKKSWRARIYSRIGTVYDSQGKYDLALGEFTKASKAWPEFREPWVRMAVTYDRMGEYKKAIESANHAVKKLDSEAGVAYVALAEAFTQTGDMTQAKGAIANAAGADGDLVKRIGDKSDDWKTAVDKLTRDDLKFPLEKELAPQPKKPARGKK